MTDCFACRHCTHSDERQRLWCDLKNRDALRRCEEFEREAGAEG